MSEYVTAAYLAKKTGFTSRYFRGLAAKGRIPGAVQASGPRGAWRFEKRAFERWWKSKEKTENEQWHPSINAATSGGVKYKETGRFLEEAFEQRLNRLQKSALQNGRKS